MSRDILQNIQVLRFIAATSIVVHHTYDILLPASSRLYGVDWSAGVDVFFVISGFIMTHITPGQFGKGGVAGPFLARRALRIVPPYWFFTALMLLTALVFGDKIKAVVLRPEVIASSFAFMPWPRIDGTMQPALAQGWTLNFEMFFYLAFAAALTLRRGLIILCVAFVLLALAGLWIPKGAFLISFWTRPVILEFVAGILLALAFRRGWRLPLWASLVCVAIAAAFWLLPRPTQFGTFNLIAHRALPVLLICIGFIFCRRSDRNWPIGRGLRLGGDASYVLYLSHFFALWGVAKVCERLGLVPSWPVWAAGVGAAIGGAVAFHLLVEKPTLDWLTRMTIKRSPRLGAATTPAP